VVKRAIWSYTQGALSQEQEFHSLRRGSIVSLDSPRGREPIEPFCGLVFTQTPFIPLRSIAQVYTIVKTVSAFLNFAIAYTFPCEVVE
jgi:hypothetical protein